MSYMEFSESLSVTLTDDIIERRIFKYMDKLGYRPGEHDTFQRGSRLGSMTSNNPRKWKTIVSVDVESHDEASDVTISYHINTTGQMILSHEEEYWEQEIAMFIDFLTEGKFKSAELEASAKDVLMTNQMLLLIGGLISLGAVTAFFYFVLNF